MFYILLFQTDIFEKFYDNFFKSLIGIALFGNPEVVKERIPCRTLLRQTLLILP